MKKRLGDFSLKYKASVTILIVALIPLIVLGTCIIVMYSNAIEERSRMHIDENIRIMTSRISGVFVNANLCSNHILLNMNQIEDENVKQQIIKDNKIQNLLNQSVLIFDGIESIVYVTGDERIYSTNIDLLKSNKEEIIHSSYKEQLLDANGKTRLFDKTETCMSVNGSVVTMGKRIIHIITGETLGYLFVNIPGEYLVQSVQNTISHYLVFDNMGNSIIDYTDGHLLEDSELCEELYSGSEVSEYRYKDEKYLIARSVVPEYGWNVIGITNLNKFNVSKEELIGIVMFIGFLITILMGVVVFAATALITKPLLKLKQGAEEIANGNLNVQFNFHTEDEIGKLGDIFNTMTLKIRELLKRVDEEARKKREYELALLHEQIKPHFLYNTLDIIIVLIEMKREWEAAHVVKKLADYYKNSLSSSEEIILIETEIQIIEDYLELQNIRYGEMFSYEIYVDEEAKKERIPRLTLQPLIENAIYHGLKYKGNRGTIRVEARVAEEKVIIKVTDDGIGIQEEKLKEIRRFAEKAEKHFGLYSVNHRLLLYYGENSGLQIESKYEEGTCITIEIPRGNKLDKNYDCR
ncbi:MAG: sensor histidine kinase [Lachnospiraceae bacterium]|nr:sensor histidine kinase [Lachnospiraceae bacterium]